MGRPHRSIEGDWELRRADIGGRAAAQDAPALIAQARSCGAETTSRRSPDGTPSRRGRGPPSRPRVALQGVALVASGSGDCGEPIADARLADEQRVAPSVSQFAPRLA